MARRSRGGSTNLNKKAPTKLTGVPNTFPYGRQTVGTIRPSTGIYGKHVGGAQIKTAVRVRGSRRGR